MQSRGTRRFMFISSVALAGLVAASTGFTSGQDNAETIELREALVVGDAGQGGRSATHTDAVEALIVTDQWSTPAEGDVITLPAGEELTWRRMEANDNGWLQGASLRGGYAFWAVESGWKRIMLLDATGHSMVYVNGEPRAGDPYRNNWPLLPVELEQGANEFLFSTGRGGVKARLLEPDAPYVLNLRDVTKPDLIVGRENDVWLGLIVINATRAPVDDLQLQVAIQGLATTHTEAPMIPPLSMRKVACRLVTKPPIETGELELEIALVTREDDMLIPHVMETVKLNVVEPGALHRTTFLSDIDGSVQYYATQPMTPASEATNESPPALFLTMHGASVEAYGQARAYSPKDWGHIVAPTNRRPFGFDWEDWGRLDALEVLRRAGERLNADPSRTYLTGHSMGGHGTWIFGATYPSLFAAIAPSAGWRSFWSYSSAVQYEGGGAIGDLLRRAMNPSDTIGLSRNFLQHGVYILHGDQDDNVPVTEARAMREHLGSYHADFAYYERPGAGHWWGSACVDWPPLFDFLENHTRPESSAVRHIEFVTANPAVSATSHWATIEAQQQALTFSSVNLDYSPPQTRETEEGEETINAKLTGTTENIARLRLDLATLAPGDRMDLEIDGWSIEDVTIPTSTETVWLSRESGDAAWQVSFDPPSPTLKNPRRAGPFKEAFRNHMIFVYGTQGGDDENAWAFAKARYDAETFWYRGNGSIPIIADEEFLNKHKNEDRNVILYGNAETNAAWDALMNEAPVRVSRGGAIIGRQSFAGDDLAVLFCYPRPESESSMVAAVTGTGLAGLRLTDRLPYFVSGIHYPDLMVIGPDMLEKNVLGVRAVGFFGNDWSIENGELLMRE